MASRRKIGSAEKASPIVGVWACPPGETVLAVQVSGDNPMVFRALYPLSLTMLKSRDACNTLENEGKIVPILRGETFAVYSRFDLRGLLDCEGLRVFIRCGKRVVRDGVIVFQQFTTAAKIPRPLKEAPPSGETDDLNDPVAGFASVHGLVRKQGLPIGYETQASRPHGT